MKFIFPYQLHQGQIFIHCNLLIFNRSMHVYFRGRANGVVYCYKNLLVSGQDWFFSTLLFHAQQGPWTDTFMRNRGLMQRVFGKTVVCNMEKSVGIVWMFGNWAVPVSKIISSLYKVSRVYLCSLAALCIYLIKMYSLSN